jgi:hypothetical protein
MPGAAGEDRTSGQKKAEAPTVVGERAVVQQLGDEMKSGLRAQFEEETSYIRAMSRPRLVLGTTDIAGIMLLRSSQSLSARLFGVATAIRIAQGLRGALRPPAPR